MPNERVSPTEAAKILGVKPGTLAVWRSKGYNKGPRFVRIGRLIKYRVADLEEFANARVVDTLDSVSKQQRSPMPLDKR
jgi:hypothetical protein